MSAFLIGPADANEVTTAKVRDRYASIGWSEQFATNRGPLQLRAFGPGPGNDNLATYQQDDTCCVVVGPFFYRKNIGEAALRGFIADFLAGRVAEADLHGHFSLALVSPRGLYLRTDANSLGKIFIDSDKKFFGTSFIDIVSLCKTRTLSAPQVYQQIWTGGTYGGRTVVTEVQSLEPVAQWSTVLPDGSTRETDSWSPELPNEPGGRGNRSLAEYTSEALDRLRPVFSLYAKVVTNPIHLAMSGGFDSRLALALCQEAGIRPSIFSGGGAGSPDVRCARQICDALGLEWITPDRTQPAARPTPEEYEQHVARAFVLNDGGTYDGLLTPPAAMQERLDRHAAGALVINGSAGETLRNFYAYPQRSVGLRDFIHGGFYGMITPWMTGRFDSDAYDAAMAAALFPGDATPPMRLERWQIERFYYSIRGRYWVGRTASANQRFGPMLYPFLEQLSCVGTEYIHPKYKTAGLLEQHLIASINPKLAALPSAYGFSFASAPPPEFRAKNWLFNRRPIWLRQNWFATKKKLASLRRRGGQLPWFLTPPYLEQLVRTELPRVSAYLNVDRIDDARILNRAVSLEYLAQELDIDK